MHRKIGALLAASALVLGVGLTNAMPASAATRGPSSVYINNIQYTITTTYYHYQDAGGNTRARLQYVDFNTPNATVDFATRVLMSTSTGYAWDSGWASCFDSCRIYAPSQANALVSRSPRAVNNVQRSGIIKGVGHNLY